MFTTKKITSVTAACTLVAGAIGLGISPASASQLENPARSSQSADTTISATENNRAVAAANPVKMDVAPDQDDSFGMKMTVTGGKFRTNDGTLELVDAQGNVVRNFKVGDVTLPDGKQAEVSYRQLSDSTLVAHIHPTGGMDRDCFGDGLLFGAAVVGTIATAPETLGGSVAAGLLVAGSEWNALQSCFG